MAKRHTRAVRAVARRPKVARVAFRLPGGGGFTLAAGRATRVLMQQAAMRWTYVLRNRARWSSLPAGARRQDERIGELVDALGISSKHIQEIARAGMVQVTIPYTREADGWEARVFPWEYALSAATRDERHGRPLTVVRQLAGAWRPSVERPVGRVLYVESAPGKLRDLYSFDTERSIVKATLRAKSWQELPSPTLAELRRRVAQFKPDIIHLAGFDSHQGLQLLGHPEDGNGGESPAASDVKDGYLLASREGVPAAVSAEQLAAALCPGGYHPRFVFCSMHNSAARIAPALVARGVQAAIGFQDAFDDTLAELFIGAFYRAWRRSEWNLATGFRRAWETLRAQPRSLRGSGLVLWSASPLALSPPSVTEPSDVAPAEPWYPDTSVRRADEVLSADIKPLRELNYALLHNRQALFERFSLINSSAVHNEDAIATLHDVDVEVTLSAGAEVAAYRTRLALATTTRDLTPDVHLPLTSDLLRSVNEAVNTSLLVEVSWGKVLYRQSHHVRLLPVDQWRDNDKDGQWLPSFVLPRDPAVAAIVERARRVVRIIRDDPAAGFEGYQAASGDEVDRQVQALWSTVLYELDLGYVNPPPSYSSAMDAQRLRTPSMIVKDRVGTCLDLTLFFAACCELVDIYPVIFLRDDHAFPGYWRSDRHQERFMEMSDDVPGQVATESRESTRVPGAQGYEFWLRQSAYREIVHEVREGRLVALESVALTEHKGFVTATKEGRERLLERTGFHSMIDIARARDRGVTPLPLALRG